MNSGDLYDRMELLIDSLNLVDPALLPPSFKSDLIDPLLAGKGQLHLLHGLDHFLEFIESILPIAEHGGSWSDWEFLRRQLNAFLGCEETAIHRCSPAKSVCVFPRSYESGEPDPSWPTGLKEPYGLVEEDHVFYLYLRFQPEEYFWFIRARISTDPDRVLQKLELFHRYGKWFPSLLQFLYKMQSKLPEKPVLIPATGKSELILGEAPIFVETIQSAEKAGKSDAPIFLMGESGTGKELFAKHVHKHSSRKNQPFVAINCAAIPHELIESELFGHEKGAFTGAYYRKIGKAEIADGGTLFLDEIGEMPLPFQAKLLRFLQEKSFCRVGGNTDIKADARIIVATHNDLSKQVREKHFREDLYYRINVIPIHIPPLRQRAGDIRLLAEAFFDRYIQKMGRKKQVEMEVFDFLEDYSFPGNVRELENLIHRMVAMSSDKVIKLNDLPSDLFNRSISSAPRYVLHPFEAFDNAVPQDRDELQAYREKVEHLAGSYVRDLERRFLYHVLDLAEGKVRKAAEIAGINRTLFYKLLKRAGIDVGNINQKV